MENSNQRIILMYHGVINGPADIPPDREIGSALYDVNVNAFREQLAFLKDNSSFITTFDKERQLPEGRRIILTFDDGEQNNYTGAFPVLREFGFLAYFFVTVNRIGKKGYMGWKELMYLRDADMIIGSHGLNHRILTQLKKEDLERELRDSKQALEDNLQVPVKDFSVPRGFYNKEVIDSALNAGYERVFVSEIQENQIENCFSRTAVMGNWSMSRFQQALNNSIPLQENMFCLCKKIVKSVLGSRAYDSLRSVLIRK